MVCKNMEGFSRKEVKGSILAHIAQLKVAHPPDSKFKLMVRSPSFKTARLVLMMLLTPAPFLVLIFLV